MAQVLLVGAIIACAWLAIREPRLLYAALWLAATSAFLALSLYLLGAAEIAVVELSVGAGLVTVLLVLAITTTEPNAARLPPALPRLPTAVLVTAVTLLAVTLVGAPTPAAEAESEAPFAVVVWEQRGADILLQIALIFVGLLTVLALLAETVKLPAVPPPETSAPIPVRDDTPVHEPALEKDLPL